MPQNTNKTKRPKPEPVAQYSSNVTFLLDAELEVEIATAYSVRVRPQEPDYRCFITKGTDGAWKCTNKECEVVRQGRARSMGSGKHYTFSGAAGASIAENYNSRYIYQRCMDAWMHMP